MGMDSRVQGKTRRSQRSLLVAVGGAAVVVAASCAGLAAAALVSHTSPPVKRAPMPASPPAFTAPGPSVQNSVNGPQEARVMPGVLARSIRSDPGHPQSLR